MINAIIIVIIVLIAVFAIKSYARKLSHGCCNVSGGDEEAVAAKNHSGYNFRCTVGINGMTCNNCAIRIANTFNRKGGVSAEVSFADMKAIIYSENTLSDFEIRSTIMNLGYEAADIIREQ